MTNEDFQVLVLEKLGNLENNLSNVNNNVKGLETKVTGLEIKVTGLENEVKCIKETQDKLVRKIDIVCEQTAILMEFRTEVTNKLDAILEDNKSIHEIIGEHEVSIRTIRRRPV